MASLFENASGDLMIRADVVEGLIAYAYLYQELMVIDGDPTADEAVAALTCLGEWADQWGSKTDMWREAWDRASMLLHSQRTPCAFVRRYTESMRRSLTEKNCLAILTDLVRISKADENVHQSEALLCNEIAEYLGLEAPFTVRFASERSF